MNLLSFWLHSEREREREREEGGRGQRAQALHVWVLTVAVLF